MTSRSISPQELAARQQAAVAITIENKLSPLATAGDISAFSKVHRDVYPTNDTDSSIVNHGKTDDQLWVDSLDSIKLFVSCSSHLGSITDLGDLTWLATCQEFSPHSDLSCQRQPLMEELDRRASMYTQDGLMQQFLYLREQQHRVQTLALSNTCRVRMDSHRTPKFELEQREEVAKLYLGRQNYFQAELILEEIVVTFQAERRTPDNMSFRIIAELTGLYSLFRRRIRAMKNEHDDMAQMAKQSVLDRVARIDSDELCARVYDAGEIDFPVSFDHKTALYLAARHNAYNLARRALDRGGGSFDQDLPNRGEEDYSVRSRFPLHTAIDNGSIDVVKLLVARGFDIEAAIDLDSNDTPLHKAAVKGSVDMLVYLVSKGANVEARRKDQQTPLILAARHGNLGIVQYLLERGVHVNSTDVYGFTALHWAAIATRTDVVRLLLWFQADITARDVTGRTALHCATCRNTESTVECIDILIDAGLDVDTKDHFMETALHKASQRGNHEAVKILLSRGAASSPESRTGTPLHQAVSVWNTRDRSSIVRTLLGHICRQDVNIKRPYDGRTPLHAAVRNQDTFGQRNLEVLVLLYSHGADVNLKDRQSKSSLDYAEDHEAASTLLKGERVDFLLNSE
ncbi:MAG: hypothetical protein L6R42_005734 [Xanthoria sp. 1 TBL-2021]|nr:MAG: hypothetical protein L6R42_005734 [Xanthoria sp. 1 TBL-2021]